MGEDGLRYEGNQIFAGLACDKLENVHTDLSELF